MTSKDKGAGIGLHLDFSLENLNGGLSPNFSEKIEGEICLGKPDLFGAGLGLFRAYQRIFGADRDQFFCSSQPRRKSRNCPERAFLAQLVPFG